MHSKNKIIKRINRLTRIIEVHPKRVKLKNIFEITTVKDRKTVNNIPKIEEKKIFTAITSEKIDNEIKP
tara:strand:+ start:621 stop:827 length:207 start_codon:yes stop_codon:yes gene_type:complete